VANTSRARVLLYWVGSMALLFGGPAASCCSSWKRPLGFASPPSEGFAFVAQRSSLRRVCATYLHICGHGRSLIHLPAAVFWVESKAYSPECLEEVFLGYNSRLLLAST
jgi:hypothetical protein